MWRDRCVCVCAAAVNDPLNKNKFVFFLIIVCVISKNAPVASDWRPADAALVLISVCVFPRVLCWLFIQTIFQIIYSLVSKPSLFKASGNQQSASYVKSISYISGHMNAEGY